MDAINKRIAIQGKRNDMHFEIAFHNNVAIGIAMFAIDLGTVRGLLDNGYGTVIVSTSLGVTTGKKASEKMVGGELICTVW